MKQAAALTLDPRAHIEPDRGRALAAQGFFQAPQQLWVSNGPFANMGDRAFVKQQIWMARFKLRDRGFNELEIRAARLV